MERKKTFISGSTDSRYLYLRDIEGHKTADKRIRYQDVKFIRRKRGSMIIDVLIWDNRNLILLVKTII